MINETNGTFTPVTCGAVSLRAFTSLFSQNIQAQITEPRQVELLLPREVRCCFLEVKTYLGQLQETTQKREVWMVHEDGCWHLIAAGSRAKQTVVRSDARTQLFLSMLLSGINSTESKWVCDSWLKLKRLKLDLFRFTLLPKSCKMTGFPNSVQQTSELRASVTFVLQDLLFL